MAEDFIPDSQFVPDPPAGAPAQAPQGASPDFVPDSEFRPDDEKYGSLGQQALAGGEGFLKGATLGASTVGERLLGVPPEDIKGREEANPWTSGLSQLGGSAALLSVTGGVAAPIEGAALGTEAMQGGQAVAEMALADGASEGAAKIIGEKAAQHFAGPTRSLIARAVGYGTEGAAFGVGGAVSDAALGDPKLNGERIVSDVGMGAAFGAGLGLLSKGLEVVMPKAAQKLQGALGDIKETLFGTQDNPSILTKGLSIPGSAASLLSRDEWQQGFMTMLNSPDRDSAIKLFTTNLKELVNSANETAADLGGQNAETKNEASARGLGRGKARWFGDAAPFSESSERLEGLPQSSPGPSQEIRQASRDYIRDRGLPDEAISHYVSADPERGARIAQAYEEMAHDPQNPEVQKAYRALMTETADQYGLIKKMGIKIEPITEGMENPYPRGSKDMIKDVKDGHLWFFPTDSGFGDGAIGDNPLLTPTTEKIGGHRLLANDVFRIVHDVFGHVKEGFTFGPNGEENAWQAHSRMYSEDAQKALASETRGQNSWVNFGPHGEANRADPAMTKYADQKSGILPEWARTEGLAPSAPTARYAEALGNFQSEFMTRGKNGQMVLNPGKVASFFNNFGAPGQELRAKALTDLLTEAQAVGKAGENYYGYKAGEESISKKIEGLAKQNQDLAEVAQAMRGTKGAFGNSGATKEALGAVGAHALGVPSPIVGAAVAALEAYKSIRNPYEMGANLKNVFHKLQAIGNIADSSAQKMTNLASSVLSSGEGRGALMATSMLPSERGYDKKVERIQELAQNPQVMMDHLAKHTEAIADAAPNVSQHVQSTILNGVQFLNSKIPRNPNQLPLSAPWEPSRSQKTEFNRYYQVVDDPMIALKQVKAGTLNSQTMEALGAVYPSLLQDMRKSLMENLTPRHVKNMPYSTKMGISMLMGQPLDESLAHPSIAANQMAFAGSQSNAAPQPKGHKTTLSGMKEIDIAGRTAPGSRVDGRDKE